MKIVRPEDRVTLLLNKFHEPFSVCTARATFRHLMTGRVVGIDASDRMYSWDGTNPDADSKETAISDISWQNLNISVFEDQPALRSASNAWYVPTVARCNKNFGFRAKNGKDISLRQAYEVYKKTCQYCLQHIPYSEATKDHIYPKTRGGTNHDFNIVLACKKCNNKKDDNFPVRNIEGNEVKPRKPLPSGMFLPDEKIIRPEWKKYLFLD